MRPRLVALGCTLAGALGLLALPGAAHAAAHAAPLPRAAMSVTTSAVSYAYGATVRITVTLRDRMPGARVSLFATPVGGKRTLVTTGKVDSAGRLYPHYKVTRATMFTAVFTGDARDAGNAASRSVTVKARVTDAITGYFKTTSIGGVTYRVYHGSATLTLRATAAPNKHGECLEPETEQYDPGAGWDADTRYGCDKLNRGSHDTAPFSLSRAIGDRYRVRGDYIRAARDTANLSAAAPWLYFEVVK
jgi:hypothetical protein